MPGAIEQIWGAISACFQANVEPLNKAQVLAWIEQTYPGQFNPNTVQTTLYRSCVNVPYAAAYKTPKILAYNRSGHTYVLAERVGIVAESAQDLAPADSSEAEDTQDSAASRFAVESHLQAYLVRNLSRLEEGLKLWSLLPPTVEYTIGNRRLDILARDIHGVPVVVELKLNRAYDQVVGQALLYRGLVQTHLGLARVRIILVAAEIADELKIACSGLSDVSLFEYSITMQTKQVSTSLSEDS